MADEKVIHVRDSFAMFAPDDTARDSVPDDPAIKGMQLALLQAVAPADLLAEASQRFQRSWYEAAVIERAAAYSRCGWPGCASSLVRKMSVRAQLASKMVRLRRQPCEQTVPMQ